MLRFVFILDLSPSKPSAGAQNSLLEGERPEKILVMPLIVDVVHFEKGSESWKYNLVGEWRMYNGMS